MNLNDECLKPCVVRPSSAAVTLRHIVADCNQVISPQRRRHGVCVPDAQVTGKRNVMCVLTVPRRAAEPRKDTHNLTEDSRPAGQVCTGERESTGRHHRVTRACHSTKSKPVLGLPTGDSQNLLQLKKLGSREAWAGFSGSIRKSRENETLACWQLH